MELVKDAILSILANDKFFIPRDVINNYNEPISLFNSFKYKDVKPSSKIDTFGIYLIFDVNLKKWKSVFYLSESDIKIDDKVSSKEDFDKIKNMRGYFIRSN